MGIKQPKNYKFVIPKEYWCGESYSVLKTSNRLFVYYIIGDNSINHGRKTPLVVFPNGEFFIYEGFALNQFRRCNSKYEKVITIKL
jgi:hypothetical protein